MKAVLSCLLATVAGVCFIGGVSILSDKKGD